MLDPNKYRRDLHLACVLCFMQSCLFWCVRGRWQQFYQVSVWWALGGFCISLIPWKKDQAHTCSIWVQKAGEYSPLGWDFKPMVTYSGQKGRDCLCLPLEGPWNSRRVSGCFWVNWQKARAGEVPRCLPSCEDDFVFNEMGMEKQKRKDSGICFLCGLSSTRKVFLFCAQHQEQNKCIWLKDVTSSSVVVKDVC